MEQILGPAVPSSRAVWRPLGIPHVAITGGPFARWQRINHEASIPLGLEQMERSGALPNLRRAGARAGEGDGPFQGYRFQDSDLYKQLEAVAWEHARAPETRYAEFIEQAAAVLARAQRPDGYLNSHYQVVKPDKIYAELEYSHELYCAGHLFQAAVAAARAGVGDSLLAVARRFADHLVEVFLTGGNDGIDGHAEVETALVELHRLTGERAYLELAGKLIDNRGKGLIADSGMGMLYAQDHLPVREADTPVGHAVRQLYLEAGIVDVYLETGDESLLECSVRRWEDMVATKTYITGGHGSRHDGEAFGERYELPPDRAYSESCAAIASIHWNWRLLLATGHGRYADLIERTLYNAFAASTSADGTRFFYVNPLQRRNDLVEDAYLGRRREWFACACCPPNIMRLVASLGGYLATETGTGLQLHQYVPGTLAGGGARLRVDTGYPWEGLIRVTVEEAPVGAWELALRIPSWSESTYVSGRLANPGGDGYFRIRRPWTNGDTVELQLDMTPRLMHPHHRIDAVRGSVALQRGPLVYCFEQADQPEGVEVDDLAIAPGAEPRAITKDDVAGVGRTVLIEIDAAAVEQPRDGLPYASKPLATSTRVTATAVPYFQWDNRDGGAMRVWMPLA
ncbi:glycoside hydrolase family 127 protein [Nonomuraea basaltis]|uniref:glycoside hydrolase family 127 protein n=1 Tax=Nonomuraea basaltis TaxID=2495887 RepID=UPI00110C4D0E|nr:beta-L-arabinofuranosidase domain-containing protein [Nonomuraea basaltis]TMR97928.1 glycoside hydrolase family 127 protein [Nonomuraea basaltis]